ncbi:DUF4123 domain-containing protein [Candidatus Poribacteria bacterium]
MAIENIIQSVRSYLFTEEGANAFAILDGASVDDLLERLYQHQPEYVCLYPGDLEPDMAEVAPYLVCLDPGSAFTNWVIEHGWGNHWGIFALSLADLRTMRQHFRKFILVFNDGQPFYFRYYDPRVLRVYLPTCNAEELATFFGQVECYLLEADAREDPDTALRFQVVSDSLQQEKLLL